MMVVLCFEDFLKVFLVWCYYVYTLRNKNMKLSWMFQQALGLPSTCLVCYLKLVWTIVGGRNLADLSFPFKPSKFHEKGHLLNQWSNCHKTWPNKTWDTFETWWNLLQPMNHLRLSYAPLKPHISHFWGLTIPVHASVVKPHQNHPQQSIVYVFGMCTPSPLSQAHKNYKSLCKMTCNSSFSSLTANWPNHHPITFSFHTSSQMPLNDLYQPPQP